MFDRILFKFLKAFKNSFYTLQLCPLSDLHWDSQSFDFFWEASSEVDQLW